MKSLLTRTSFLLWPAFILTNIMAIAAAASAMAAVAAEGLESRAVGVVDEVWKNHGLVGLALLTSMASTAFNLWMTKQMVNIAAKSAANHANSASALSSLADELRRRPCICDDHRIRGGDEFGSRAIEIEKREKRDDQTPYIS